MTVPTIDWSEVVRRVLDLKERERSFFFGPRPDDVDRIDAALRLAFEGSEQEISMSSLVEKIAAALYVFDGGDAVTNEHALGTSEVYLNRAEMLLGIVRNHDVFDTLSAWRQEGEPEARR